MVLISASASSSPSSLDAAPPSLAAAALAGMLPPAPGPASAGWPHDSCIRVEAGIKGFDANSLISSSNIDHGSQYGSRGSRYAWIYPGPDQGPP